MAKAVIAVDGSGNLGTVASSGTPAVFGSAAVVPVVAFAKTTNPDGTVVKDTRK